MRKLTFETNRDPESATSRVVGQPVKHESADRHVCGAAPYVDDYVTPADCLHASLICAAIAKGNITRLDLSAVAEADGVIRVLDASHIPGNQDIGILSPGDPLLAADGEVRYFGQPVALIIAESHQQAWQAAKRARIEYEENTNLTLNYDPTAPPEPLLPSHQMGKPIAEQTFSEAEIEISGEMHTGGQEHFYLEGQISLAEPTEDGGMFLRSSTQNPSEIQKQVAQVLALSLNKVTVDTRRMGGAFGGKESQAAQWACLAALGAFQTRHPVKLRLPRRVDMVVTGKRHPFYQRYHLAAGNGGEISAAHIELNGLCGHSPDLSNAIVDRAMFHAENAYYLGDTCIQGHRLKTDTVSNTAFRGFGGPQAIITIEKAIQQLAIAVGQDALDIRLKNLYREGKNITPYGMEVKQFRTLQQIIQQLAQSCDYRKRRNQITQWNRSSPVLKRGLALTPVKFGISFTAQHLNQAGALIHVYTDGTVMVSHGGTEMGQGLHTKIQQIVAQVLGIPLNDVLVTSTRTDKVPNTSATAASSGADLNGMAAYRAALTIKQRLLDFARDHYPCAGVAQPLTINNGEIYGLKQDLSWRELIAQAYISQIPLSATGFYRTPGISYNRETASGRPFYYFALGACCSEVTIDTLTGEMGVDRVDILHDVGSSLNPAIDAGQIEGAFVQGLGWLTSEELLWDKNGQLLSNSPMNYKIPTAGDYPKQMTISLFADENPEYTIYRSKAVGEPPFVHANSVWCAIYDAVASLSTHQSAPELHAPATGEAILNACDAQRAWLDKKTREK